MTIKNTRFLKALLRQPVDKTPIWLMRQAGRYLPEYLAIRQQVPDFMDLCKNPALACEVTLQPLARFDLDAAIVFSDILTIPDAMGLGLSFVADEGPRFQTPIRDPKQIEKLHVPDPEQDLAYVSETIRLIKRELADRIPLIGFSGSPWTLATYMVEGGSSKTFSVIKAMLFEQPHVLHQLLRLLADAVTKYLNAQIAAGADAVMIFDTWGGILSPRDYQLFSLEYMQQIIAGLTAEKNGQRMPCILFTKNGGYFLEAMANSGCDAIGLDWMMTIGEARKRVGDKVAIQGNMDPAILYAHPKRIEQEVASILANYGSGPGHIFNLGHGIQPNTPPEHVKVLVDAVHDLSITK